MLVPDHRRCDTELVRGETAVSSHHAANVWAVELSHDRLGRRHCASAPASGLGARDRVNSDGPGARYRRHGSASAKAGGSPCGCRCIGVTLGLELEWCFKRGPALPLLARRGGVTVCRVSCVVCRVSCVVCRVSSVKSDRITIINLKVTVR